MHRRLVLAVGLLASALALAGCSTYTDALARGQRAFEQGEQDRALAIFRSMQSDVEHLSIAERARYAYLRGMTDYRIGYRADARHWLAIGAETEKLMPGSLTPAWTKRLADALGKLDERVYENGYASLSNSPEPATSAPSADSDEGDDASAEPSDAAPPP